MFRQRCSVNADASCREFTVRLFKHLANAFLNTVRQAFFFRLTNAVSMCELLSLSKRFVRHLHIRLNAQKMVSSTHNTSVFSPFRRMQIASTYLIFKQYATSPLGTQRQFNFSHLKNHIE